MKTATIIISDEGFIVPSLVLAKSIAESNLSSVTDVLLFLVDVDNETIRQLLASDLGNMLQIKPLKFGDFGVSQSAAFRPGHVSKTAMGRLAICNSIPVCYENIVYMDGDMQIVDDAKPLFTYRVPDGEIAAAAEHFIIFGEKAASRPTWLNDYLGLIGLSSPDQYFNSGLLAFRRDTWAELGPRALRFFNDNSSLCKHHDQTALNAVCHGKWRPVSPAYNYQSFYMPIDHRTSIRPKIAHFTSSPKPWQSKSSLWPVRHALPYSRFLAEYPFLKRYMSHVASPGLLDRLGLQRLKAIRRRLLDREQIARRASAFESYLKRTEFVVN